MTSQTMTRNETAAKPREAILKPLATRAAISPVMLRLTLAAVMLPHGMQKLFGWFGGYGWTGTMGFLTEKIGLPSPLAVGIILLEAFGPILLLLGLGTRFVALGFAGLMVGAIATVHWPNGFFMNWSGAQAGEGFEFHLLVIGIALALAIAGAGRWSLDRRLAARR